MKDIIVDKVWVTETEVWIHTTEGKEACARFADYPRLKNASQEQREQFSTDAFGIRWEEIDEDLSFEGFFLEEKPNFLYDLFITHPELNASAVARRMGISQSLFAQYISGTKKPSETRFNEILSTIRSIGKELESISV